MYTVTKRDLTEKIAKKSKYTHADVKEVVQICLDCIIAELSNGNRVELRKFGIFMTKRSSARKARNPKTGDIVEVPQKNVVKFKSGKMIKDKEITN